MTNIYASRLDKLVSKIQMETDTQIIEDLNFDFYQNSIDDLRMYVTSGYLNTETGRQKTLIYEHSVFADIEESSALFGGNDLDQACGDEVLSSQNLIIVACKRTK